MAQTVPPPKRIMNAINGVDLMLDEPFYHLEGAHAVACLLQDSVSGDLNTPIIESAARAVCTLIELAAIGFLNKENQA
jgi:hypothetical protein